ncbi:MAG: rhomboid family intramembrane serine protease [Promethearchaeota archaeon]
MAFCEHCGEKINFLPFKCKYCGGAFCKEHRLPENHQCTFELKHVPNTFSGPEESASKSDYSRKTPREFKKYMKRQDKQKQKTIKLYKSYNDKPTQNQGTKVIIMAVFVLSIASLAFPYNANPLALSRLSFLNFWLWTFVTSAFVSFSYDLFGLFFLVIIMLFFYMIIKNIERAFGTKFLLRLYLLCALFSGLLYFILWIIMEMFLIPPGFVVIVPYGLASGALLGVICFTIFINWNRQMTFLIFFMPIRMKGKTIITFLILIKLIPGLLFGISSPPLLLIYLPDLGGILASFLVYNFKLKRR